MEAAGKRYIYHGSRSDIFTIYNFSDIHYGSIACAKDQVRDDIERVRNDPFSFYIIGGDYAEYITFHDRRFDPECIDPDITVKDMGKLGFVLTSHIRDMFQPIKHKCLGICIGNHEAKYCLENDRQDLHGWLCTELGAPNLGYSALFDLVFIRDPKHKMPVLKNVPHGSLASTAFRFLVHHGAGSAVTPGGKLNRLIQIMQAFNADIYMIGHVHDQKGQRLVSIGADEKCERLVSRDKIGVISGSYLKTYAQSVTTYGEKKAYAPVPLGASFVQINPETREVRAEI